MRIIGILLLQLLLTTSAYGQSFEFSAHLNSGLFSFGGKSAAKSSAIIISDVNSEDNYTNNPFGSNNAISYGIASQVLRVTSGNILFGIQGGFELLRSSVTINSVYNDLPGGPAPASGNTILKHSFINLHPMVGYRILVQNIEIDITAGPEVGFMLNSKEKGEAELDGGGSVKTDTPRSEAGNDYRLRSSVTVYYKQWGISAGYSYGLRNYTGSTVDAPNQTYSRFIRFGISYKIF